MEFWKTSPFNLKSLALCQIKDFYCPLKTVGRINNMLSQNEAIVVGLLVNSKYSVGCLETKNGGNDTKAASA